MNRIILAAVLALVLIAPASVVPSFAHEEDDKSFKIRSFGMDKNGNPYLTVKGVAGSEAPHEEGVIFAYAFVTDAGLYAVTSHIGNDTPGEEHDDLEWHAHKIVLDGNCVQK